MMLARSPLVLLFGLGALMTPTFAADPATTPTCGDDPGPSVSCSASNKEWKCPPTNTCGTTMDECFATFQACTPPADTKTPSTKVPPKTTAATTTPTTGASDESQTTGGSTTGTGAAATATNPPGSGASGPGFSWAVAAGVMGMGVFAGGLIV